MLIDLTHKEAFILRLLSDLLSHFIEQQNTSVRSHGGEYEEAGNLFDNRGVLSREIPLQAD